MTTSFDIEGYPAGWLGRHLYYDGFTNKTGVNGWSSPGVHDAELRMHLVDANYSPDTGVDGDTNWGDVEDDAVTAEGHEVVDVEDAGVTKTLNGEGIYIDDSANTTTFDDVDNDFRYVVLVAWDTDADSEDGLVALLDPGELIQPSNENVDITISGGELVDFSHGWIS